MARGTNDWWSRTRALLDMDFININDTPGTYGDAAGKTVKVVATEDGLDWSEALIDDHHARHEAGGEDEIALAGLTPGDHHLRHENGGADELSLAGLTPGDHHTRHEAGGVDEIDLDGLIANESLWGIHFYPVEYSEKTKIFLPNEYTTTSAIHLKVKNVRFFRSGNIRLYWRMKSSVNGSPVGAIIGRNGVEIGVETISTSTNYAWGIQEVPNWVWGDYIELWYYSKTAMVGCSIKDFYVCFTDWTTYEIIDE